MTYAELEHAIFDCLFTRHKQDPTFTFSVRKKASKGAEADYFIGTKTSHYFGFTLWQIPQYYPGASTDFCNFMIDVPDDGNIKFRFQIYTPNAPERLAKDPSLAAANKLALDIEQQLNKLTITTWRTRDTQVMLYVSAMPEQNQFSTSPSDFGERLLAFVDQLSPIIDASIATVKEQHPELVARRIELGTFQTMLTKMYARQHRYTTSTVVENQAEDAPEEPPTLSFVAIDETLLPGKNLLLYGPPGTGKTYYLQNRLLTYFHDEGQSKRYSFVTFHQAFTYEDFVEGLKPVVAATGDGRISYAVEPGLFYVACDEASKLAGFDSLTAALEVSPEQRMSQFAQAKPYALFIDEINRANVSATFGELITLLEENKRLGADQEIASLLLPYSKKSFGVPLNLYVIGTMNTADRSIEALDTALRRRFIFREMPPNETILELTIDGISLRKLLRTINERLERLGNREQRIGHAYLSGVETAQQLLHAFDYSIVPLLQEYFYKDYRKIGLVLGKGFVAERAAHTPFADFDADLANEYEDVRLWELRPATLEAIKEIL